MRRDLISRRALIFVTALILLATGTLSMLSAPSRVQAQDVIVLPKTTNNTLLNVFATMPKID